MFVLVFTAAKCAQLERGQSTGNGCYDPHFGYLAGCLNKSFCLGAAGGLGGSGFGFFTATSCRNHASLNALGTESGIDDSDPDMVKAIVTAGKSLGLILPTPLTSVLSTLPTPPH